MGIFSLFQNSETIYFPGCFSSALAPEIEENYEEILKKLNIDFKKSKDFCCGGFLDEAGYEKKFTSLARENINLLEKQKAKKIIVSCALCHKTFTQNYKDFSQFNIETEHILTLMLKTLKQNPQLIKSIFYEPIIYLDSCYLSRYSNLVEEPREILKILGYKIIELAYNKEECFCDGSCGDYNKINQEISAKIAKKLIDEIHQKAKKTNVKKIVVADARIYKNLQEKLKDSGLELLEISELIKKSLNII